MIVSNVRNISKGNGDHMSSLPSYFIWTIAVFTSLSSYFKFPTQFPNGVSVVASCLCQDRTKLIRINMESPSNSSLNLLLQSYHLELYHLHRIFLPQDNSQHLEHVLQKS